MQRLVKEKHIVGDIGFTAITSTGDPVCLEKDGEELVFYSAARVPVLEWMAKQRGKSVILVAQSDKSRKKDKVPAIYASIAGYNHQYVSHLITDEPTCHELLRF